MDATPDRRRLRTPRTARKAAPRFAWPLALALALCLLVLAVGHAAAGAAPDAPLSHAELVAVAGGGCGSSCDSGSGGDDDDDDPDKVGRPYWVTSNVVVNSVDPGVARLIEYVSNYDDDPLQFDFTYERRVVRSVGFTGGYADYFEMSIGGEIDQTTTRRLGKTIGPWESLKVYSRFETTRKTVYGTRYQDYDDGSRRVVARDSGPYASSVTRLGYVTNPLR